MDEQPTYDTLPEAVETIVTNAGDQHWDNLQAHLGTHYYDGVIQLMLDEAAAQ